MTKHLTQFTYAELLCAPVGSFQFVAWLKLRDLLENLDIPTTTNEPLPEGQEYMPGQKAGDERTKLPAEMVRDLNEYMERALDRYPTSPNTCYHCNLSLVWTGDGALHRSISEMRKWISDRPSHQPHQARFEPICRRCGQDNANGTHDALTATGHLSHKFLPAPREED